MIGYIVIIGVFSLAGMYMSNKLKSTFAKYGKYSLNSNMTGRDVADAHPISAITSLSGTLASKMHWMGAWKESDYKLNDVVRDGEWTMVALNDTSERAAPQPIGDPYYLFDAELVNTSHPAAAYISVGQRYTITTPGWLLGCRIYAVGTENYMYRIIVVDRTDPSDEGVSSPHR